MTANAPTLASPTGFWSRLGWSLWPARCLACAEPGLPGCDLCAACWAQWPRAGRCCLGCAMPLVADAPACEDAQSAATAPADDGRRASAAAPPARIHIATGAVRDRCGACRGHPSPLHEVRAAAFYRAPLDRLLPRFKFHRDLAAGRLLATTMAAAFAPLAASESANGAAGTTPRPEAARSNAPRSDPPGAPNDTRRNSAAAAAPAAATLIPVPLHRSRLRQRGYDQSLELARTLSRRLSLPLSTAGLQRARDTPPQSRLDAAARRRNLRDAFAWTEGIAAPTHAILVDDVMTTGATLHAAALALRRAGAQRVDAWVCARTL